MDSGLCPGNYYDYLDDDIAKQRELELFDTWNGPGAFLGMSIVVVCDVKSATLNSY